MMVNGPLEIYSTVIGAKLYDNLFDVLVSFGVAFVPLLMVFFSSIRIFFETPFQHAGDISLKRTGFHLFGYVFSMMLFVAPTHRLDVTGITYRPVCMNHAVVSRFGDTGTTYDNAFENLDYQNVRIPWGLAFILTGTSGIINAAIVSLPCKTDVQAIQNTIDTTRLTPALTQQVERFQTECYATARAQFDKQSPSLSTYQNTMKSYGGQSDLSWMGSHVFQRLYYSGIYPASPVPGFPYAAYPYKYQSYNSKSGVPAPKWGFPTCQQWWGDPQHGLESHLVALVQHHAPNNPHLGEIPISTQLNSWLANVKRFTHLGSQLTSQDIIVHSLLYAHGAEDGFGRLDTGWMTDSRYNPVVGDTGFISSVGSEAGQGIDVAFNTVKRAEVRQEIPILQAVLMAICLSLGPLILMLGGYQGRVIFSYYFVLSSIITITFVEKLIHYLELSLHASMNYDLYSMGSSAMMYNIFTKLYLTAPIIYLMIMSACGIGIGSAMQGFFSSPTSGGAAKFAEKQAGKAASAATKL